MGSQDEDVAAILGLPNARFAAQSRVEKRRRRKALIAMGAVATIGVLCTIMVSLAWRQRADTSKAEEVAHAQVPPARAPQALPQPERSRQFDVAIGRPAEAIVSSDNRQEREVPPAPPPPSAETLAELRAATPSKPLIGGAPGDELRGVRLENLKAPEAAALATETPSPEPTVSVWISEPTGEEVASAYPADALRDGAPGSVVMACVERVDGKVRDCRILDERPYGSGFGHAALRLSRHFRFSPVLVDGRPVEAEVRIPYDFAVVD